MKQTTMFTTEDLPLFSGTAATVTLKEYQSAPAHRQESFVKCKTCLDTGIVSRKAKTELGEVQMFCMCQAGQQARADDRKLKCFR